jgi:hypothetical protein
VTHFVLSNFFPHVPQRLTPGAVRILRQCRHADTTKARTELGFVPTPIEDAVRDAFDHFIERGLIEGRTAATRRFVDLPPPQKKNGQSGKQMGASV